MRGRWRLGFPAPLRSAPNRFASRRSAMSVRFSFLHSFQPSVPSFNLLRWSGLAIQDTINRALLLSATAHSQFPHVKKTVPHVKNLGDSRCNRVSTGLKQRNEIRQSSSLSSFIL